MGRLLRLCRAQPPDRDQSTRPLIRVQHKSTMAKQIKKRRVGPAESDPRQDNGAWTGNPMNMGRLMGIADEIDLARFRYYNHAVALAREFGPWVKAADGSWFRDRSKRRRKR